MSTRAVTPTVAAPVAVLTPLQRPMLQRTCDCGQHTGGGDCDDCKKKKKMPIQRHANGLAAPAIAPPIVHDVLRSPGQPLDEDTQSHFEAKFRHDFSQVRVHTDEQAAESARAVSAHAYTVGNHLVFGAGRYSPANGSGRRLLAHELTHVVQQQHESVPSPQYRLEIGPSQDRYEREADELADRMANRMGASQEPDSNLSLDPLSLTHMSPTPVAPRVQRAEASASAAPAPSPAAVPLLVEDDARDTKPGQMRKGDFLDKLQASVCATADEVLSSVGRSAQGCPFIERWIGHLRTKKSQFVERGIRKYAPQSAGVTKAQDYIPFVTARVRRGMTRWAQTGEITEVPDELKGQLMVANLLAGVDRLLSGIGGAVGGAVSAIAGGVKKAASAIGGVFAKERDGGVRDAGDPQEIQAQLRSGHPLDTGVKSRMETAFGGSFSDVRVHTDSSAAELSTRLNARAFTVGSDVAFGAGEYQPGTLIGDALIAHELAHVMQQGGNVSPVAPISRAAAEYNALEEDADLSAVGAVVSLWGGTRNKATKFGENALPHLRSGLRLQRCGGGKQEKKTYEEYVKEGAAKLAGVTFPKPQKGVSVYSPEHGLRETSVVPGTGDLTPETLCSPQVSASSGKSYDYWYDQRFWEPAVDPELKSCKLVLREDKKDEPGKAIDELFDHQERWHVACAEFVQIAHLYALRHTLGDEGFRKRVQTGGNRLELRRRGSTGIKTKELYVQGSPGGVMLPATGFFKPRSAEQLLADAPVGSRVRWSNDDDKAKGQAFENENTVKLGPDKYLAYPLSTSGLSRKEVELRTARETNPKADDAYIRKYIFISEIEYFAAP